MPMLQISVQVKVDGRDMQGFPLNLVFPVPLYQEYNVYMPVSASDTTFDQLPVGGVLDSRVLCVQTVDVPAGVRITGGETGNSAIRLGVKGGLLVWGVEIPADRVTVNYVGTALGKISGFAGGH